MMSKQFEVGQVKAWLDQGPALLMAVCQVEAESIAIGTKVDKIETEQGWVIRLLQTGEILTVHEETLHNGEKECQANLTSN